MPGLVMESNQVNGNQPNARPPGTKSRPNYNDAAAATRQVVKKEDNYNDDDDDNDNDSEGDDGVYRSRPQLQEPEILIRSLADLMKRLQAGDIDVDPEYQRDVVWTADRMTSLINSLMENFYIPPILLNKKPRPQQDVSAPQEIYVCVDGKQRLSSVLAFIKGMIPCHDHRGEKWWFCEPEGSKRKRVISEQQQKQFFLKEFVAFEYDNLSPEQEEDLFARVQMGMQLNLAEKMRASTGPWQELARLYVVDFPAVYSLMKDRARSKDFQLTLSCFSQIVECMHPTAANGVPVLKTNHTHLPKLLSNKGAVDDALKSHLASVWNTFKDLIEADPDTFTNANKYLRGVQTFAPVEMVAVSVLISMHSETRNNRLLLGDIQAMRTAVRENFVDLRLNATVWKWFWEYIENLETIRGAIDGSTLSRRTNQPTKKNVSSEGAAASSTVAAISAAAAAPKKGRFTARTKRRAEAPVDEMLIETPAAVEQEPVAAPMPDLRSPKRRRTENSVPSGLLDDVNALSGSINHTTGRSTGTAEMRTNPDSGLPPPPAEVRRQHMNKTNGYQSAHRSAITILPSGLPEYHPQSAGEPPRAPVAPMQAGPGPFSSSHSMWQDGGTQQPQAMVTLREPLPGQPRSTQKGSTSTLQSTCGQHGEPIDLTSDTEQERASLLSAFKTRPVSTRPSSTTSKPTPEPASQKRKSTAEKPRISSQEQPNRENNP
ncbi:uncharacterized protein M421DRAFT_419906 [Didymella exigua CBS 183.55]|uniref:GmrSD restriction endonucleases N-terminal domain-containing protein n=1 Tax=Didymella exigua CBS 183.55 TaxID=1150837 RepID=A0A6A5RPM0_9PLEO|nr:uncharacterized protein M421DRAFT_419906 [Didymella exigua CBS 183.55]KAF1929373.1 hypothetical protein M421DRAFT_419906 [Didymella exigua CBS 183.55]